jgi:phosphoribosylformylglycinamidine synthase II
LEVEIKGSTEELAARLKAAGVDLSPDEARKIRQLIGRDPTLVELFIFDIMWSEHCSYKSSKHILKRYLPTEGSRVVLGPGEDAGVVRLAEVDGARYVLVVAHESHNHPSQILPVEGAATGVGGIVRDVYCMGADVVGVMDALRFGDPDGPNSETVREVAAGVVRGIWEYANALGVPNVGGDVVFDRRYDDNCLVNVIALGVAREEEIIRSRVPADARDEPYDLIIVGKPTDRSGLGGATMASRVLDEAGTADIGAVQIHDPFLKRMLTVATREVLAEAARRHISIGFKDLGAGGIACAVSEIVDRGGFGAELHLDRCHLAFEDIEPHAVACSETQERYCLAVPADFTEAVLRIYNDDFELPHIYRGARASVIGRVTARRDVVMLWKDQVVADLPAATITEGICYERQAAAPRVGPSDYAQVVVKDLKNACLAVLGVTSIASKHYIYRHYDSEVKGLSVLKPGEADACVICLPGTKIGIATSVDGNPRYSALDPRLGAVLTVCEGLRNIACVGAVPIALTDCLNFGNPEDPHVFWDFVETVKGIGEAATALGAHGTGEAVPVVSGNVSFYNESSKGTAIPPSPVVGCYGFLDDYSVGSSLAFKEPGNQVLLVGRRKRGLGGSALLEVLGRGGQGRLPEVDLEEERVGIHAVTEIVRRGMSRACHDIGEGGLFAALAEMVLGGWGTGRVGADVSIDLAADLSIEEVLFGETGGFLVEVRSGAWEHVEHVLGKYAVCAWRLGRTVPEHALVVRRGDEHVVRLEAAEMRRAWMEPVERALR